MVFKLAENLDHYIDHNFLEWELLCVFHTQLVAIYSLEDNIDHLIAFAVLKLIYDLIDDLNFSDVGGLIQDNSN